VGSIGDPINGKKLILFPATLLVIVAHLADDMKISSNMLGNRLIVLAYPPIVASLRQERRCRLSVEKEIHQAVNSR
jgi:ABC-type uncharacterized transport system ATPase component